MAKTWTIRTTSDLDNAFLEIEGYEPPLVIKVEKGEAALRTLDQNALVNVWYRQIGEEYGLDFEEARAYCKLIFGIPMLRTKSKHFRNTYDKYLKHMSYREKMNVIMHTDLPVTSTFNTKEMSEYMESMQRYFADKGLRLKSIGDR